MKKLARRCSALANKVNLSTKIFAVYGFIVAGFSTFAMLALVLFSDRDSAASDHFNIQQLVAACAVFLLVTTLLIVGLVRYLYRQLGGDPTHLAAIAQSLKDGVLNSTGSTATTGIYGCISQTAVNLRAVISGILEVAVNISSESKQALEGNSDLGRRTQEQATNL